MEMPNALKLIALKCTLEKYTKTLEESWEYSKQKSREKCESKGESKTELELALDAYAAYSYACGSTALEQLEMDGLIVVSPSQKFEAACKLAATPFVFVGTKVAVDEILSIAEKAKEAQV